MALTTAEKLKIANSGGQFQADEYGGWVGVKIRKGDKLGIVISDMNGMFRTLTVRFDDGLEHITLCNIGTDSEHVHEYEWYSTRNECWYRF